MKKNVGGTKKEIEIMMNENGMGHPTDFLLGLVRYVEFNTLRTEACLGQPTSGIVAKWTDFDTDFNSLEFQIILSKIQFFMYS